MSSADDVPEQDGDPSVVDGSAVQPDVGALYKRYVTAMRDSASKAFGTRAVSSDVDEAISVVVANLMNAHSKGTLQPKDNWEPYLRRAARNAALTIVKDRLKTVPLDATADRTEEFDPRIHSADPVATEIIKRAERQDAREVVLRAGLTHRELEVLDAYYAKQMTNEAIGEQYGVSGQAISKTRRGAQEKLKRLREEGDRT